MANSNPTKLCECGCGRPAPIATYTNRPMGYEKGRPVRFIRGHCFRNRPSSNKTHGHAHPASTTYQSWRAMINRCYRSQTVSYSHYGGRGIKVCKQWHKFENFLAYMGEKPEGKSLDRYPDNDGNYEPGNCRWATSVQQANNKQHNRMLSAFGETKTIAEWSRDSRCAVKRDTLYARLNRKWTAKAALTTPVKCLSILSFLLIVLPGCASMSPSERAWQTLHVLDVAQTLNTAGSNDPCWQEYGIPTKYLIGEKPDPESVIAWGVGLSVLHYYADRWLERSDFSGGLKTAIRSINLTGKGFTVVKNHAEGARPFGDNARSCI